MGASLLVKALCICGMLLQRTGFVISSDASRVLVETLLGNYPKYPVRPVKNESTAVVVKHRMNPIQLIDMDEKNQVITLKSWLGQVWTDEYLTWEPDTYNGLAQLQIPISEIWQPDTVLYGSVTADFQRHFETDAIIDFKGTVTALQPMVLQATCSIDATLFPFDEQRCDFKFASWSYHIELIDYVTDPTSTIDRFTENGEWKVLEMPVTKNEKTYVCCPEKFSDVTYTIHLQRRSMFYVVNIILPSFLACILISVGFYLPSDSGERVSLCVISILSQFVFLTVISDYMPPTAEVVPYLQRYFFITIGVAVLSAFATAWTLNMHFKGPVCTEPPSYLKSMAFYCLARLACTRVRIREYRKRSKRRRPQISRADDVPLGSFVNGTSEKDHLRNSLDHREIDAEKQDSDFYDRDPETQQRRLREWREISRIVDRAYFVLYTMVQVGLVVAFLVFIAVKGRYSHIEEDPTAEDDH